MKYMKPINRTKMSLITSSSRCIKQNNVDHIIKTMSIATSFMLLFLLANVATATELTVTDPSNNYRAATDDVDVNIPDFDQLEAKKISAIFNLNVFSYYDDLWKYDTNLKQRGFKHTEEYQNLYNKLMKIKKQAVKHRFTLIESSQHLYNYDENKKAFRFNNGSNSAYTQNYSHEFNGFCFDSIPVKKESFDDNPNKYQYSWYIPVKDETVALNIENNIEHVRVRLKFNVSGTISKTYQVFKGECEGGSLRLNKEWSETISGSLPNCVNVSVELFNIKTGEVYFTKSYK